MPQLLPTTCHATTRSLHFKLCAFLVLAVLAIAGYGYAFDDRSAPAASRPNIVIIMADDMGFSDLGCYGSEINTPRLDQLARDGLRFTQFYNTGRCCPTRASLLTGLYPHQAGVGHMETALGPAAYQGYLNRSCVTIAELLRGAGYRTLMAGKWNVGAVRPHWPVDRGFDRYFGLLRGASNYFDPTIGPRRNASQYALDDQRFTSFGERFYATDTFTDYAVQWLAEAAKQGPFFLYLAYTAPHSPLHAWPDDVARYRGKYLGGWDALRVDRHRRMIELGLLDRGCELPARDPAVPAWNDVPNHDFLDLKMAVYAAQIDRLDQQIGRVVAQLGSSGAADNTLVLFLSDNGADADEERGSTTVDVPPGGKESSHIYGHGWAHVSNTPWRGYKHQAFEGGIATPLIAHWPRGLKSRGITHEPGHVIDLLATCIDVAGVDYPSTFNEQSITPLEGRSLVPIFREGRREPHEALYFEHEGNRAVRQGDWKLVARNRGDWELYHLAVDRAEQQNLAAAQPGKVAALQNLYESWARRAGVVPWDELKRKP